VLTAVVASLALSSVLRQDAAGKIVFVSDRDGNPEIYSMDADGSNVKRLTDSNAKDVEPCWSPDGKRIAWASNRTGDWDIWVMDADGGNQIDITHDKEHQDTNPMWSKSEDNTIAFVANRHFYTIQPDGEETYERTGLLLMSDCEPALNPTALRFCVRDQNGHLLIREGWETSLVLPLTYGSNNIPVQIYHPAWSSDGADIMFDSGGQTPKIYTVDVSDKSCEEIAMEGYGYEGVFAKGDTAAVFTSPTGEGKGTDIFMIDLDAGEKTHGLPKPTNLTHTAGNDSQPCWWEPPAPRR